MPVSAEHAGRSSTDSMNNWIKRICIRYFKLVDAELYQSAIELSSSLFRELNLLEAHRRDLCFQIDYLRKEIELTKTELRKAALENALNDILKKGENHE